MAIGNSDNAENDETTLNIHPREYAKLAFRQNGFDDLESIAKACNSHMKAPTAAMLEAYVGDIVTAVRKKDMEQARLLFEDGKFVHGVNACNRFGESIMHMACRRGHLDMVRFLVLDVGLKPSEIRDDYHRTPLHDAFWTPTPSFDVVDFLLKQPSVPDLLMCKDKRGFTPLDYTRAEDHGRWLEFLRERKTALRPTTLLAAASTTSSLVSKRKNGNDDIDIGDYFPSVVAKGPLRKRQRLVTFAQEIVDDETTGLKIIGRQ